jgi:hypothetical protein
MKYDVLWLQRGVKAHDLGSMNSTNVANSAECIVSEHRLDTVPSSSLLIGMVIILGLMGFVPTKPGPSSLAKP